MEVQNDSRVLTIFGEPNIDNVHADASASNTDPFKFSHGLTGIDQPANYLFVNVLMVTMLVPVFFALIFRIQQTADFNYHFLSRAKLLEKGSLPFSGHHQKTLSLLVLLVYVASNIAYCLALPEQLPAQRFAEFRGRCGALAAFNLIFTILFALRNNPFTWLLGISYNTFSLFHRWTARLVILETMAHVAAFLYNTYCVDYKGQGGWSSVGWVLGHSVSYQWGLAGFVSFIFLSIQSVGPLRRACYDTFLTLHRLGILVAIAGVYFHLAKHALPQLPWAYLSMTLLVFEPVIRIGRIIYYNFSWKYRSWIRITAIALPGEAIRVEISIPRPWAFRPGTHTYIYLPRLAPFSAHPFSIAWYAGSATMSHGYEKVLTNVEDLATKCGPSTISCILRARAGMTRSLYDRASRAETKSIALWGMIQGPYGGFHSLSSYGTLVLFAAGVGITHQLSFVRDSLIGYCHNTSATRKILLVWSIPNIECIEWIYSWLEELASIPGFSEIAQMQLYVSRPSPQIVTPLPLHLPVELHTQRCDPQEIIDEQILSQVGAMAVTVCGPGGFNDSVRAVVRRRVGLRSIYFFEEAFCS